MLISKDRRILSICCLPGKDRLNVKGWFDVGSFLKGLLLEIILVLPSILLL